MKLKLVYIIFIFCSQVLFAQEHESYFLSLDGKWGIIFDHENIGLDSTWYLDKNFDAHTAIRQIDVPSCWEEYKKNYEGVAFYRKKFTLPKSWENKILELKFDASNYKTEVWINDQPVGFHEGGYTPFSFRIDKLAKPGEENTLTARVIGPIILTDQRIDGLGRQEVPMWRGAIAGGIWQPVNIYASGTTRIADVFIKPDIRNNTASFNIEIENTETGIRSSEISLKIYSKDNKVVASREEEIKIVPGKNKLRWELTIPDAEYWSVENPYLYNAEIEINTNDKSADRWSANFGLREFTVKNNKFYLNGKPIYLKAAFFEGLYPVKLAYPDSREMAVKEIQLAKEAGFNMIRPWRKPAPPMWFNLCDSIGMLTVGSLAVECMTRPISTSRLPFVVENELRKTILANRNRTSIVQWELFNEIHRPVLTQMLNSMSVLARELDPTRLILDESGGWGEGAKIYLPYQRTAQRFNDIHHYSGSQVHEQEYNGYLTMTKTPEEMEGMGFGIVKPYGRNVVPGLMSYVSELGYGSFPDLTLSNRLFETHGNPIVAPSVYHKKLAKETELALQKMGFEKLYPDIQKYYLEQQKMHGIANKRIIEAVRSNPDVAGFCVHALVAGDWVIGAGLLDLWRNPKTLVYDMTREASQEQIVAIRILPRNIYAEKGARLEITGISELDTESTTISIKIKSEKGKVVLSNDFEKDFQNGISKLFVEMLNTDKWQGSYTVNVQISDKSGKLITSNSQPFDVFTSKQLQTPDTKIAIVDPANTLIPFLQESKINFVSFSSETNPNTLVLVGKALKQNSKYTEQVKAVKEFVNNGGYAIFLEVPGENVPGFNRTLEEVETEVLPFGAQLLSKWQTLGAWMPKSHIVKEHPVFKGLPTNLIMHGVYENVHPQTSMVKQQGDYIAGLVGTDHFPDQDIMLRHYNGPGETWWAADVLETKLGKGKMLLSTFNLIDNLGKDPVAEKILFNMIEFADKQ
ncbi:MAG: sugar-binding domain-containing protein [Bacteroidota bacterium]